VTPTYKIEELAAEAGVSPRTVRYYVQRGLLPAPEFRGKDTAYGQAHLLRLHAIKRLQQAHLPLDEIQARLLSMTEAELVRLARGEGDIGGRQPFDEPRDSGSVKRGHPYRSPGREPVAPGEPHFEPYPYPPPDAFPHDPKATAQVYRLADGVELWVRNGLTAASRALVREILNRYPTTDEKDDGR
jgi:DNA-binding transcriptional MerR regulator